MATTRRYFFAHAGPFLQEGGHQLALKVIQWQAESRWWYTEPRVEGQALGTLTFSFVVAGDDQWQVHKRAMGLARTVYRGLKLPLRLVPEPMWTSLPTHMNRGHQRTPRSVPVAPAVAKRSYRSS